MRRLLVLCFAAVAAAGCAPHATTSASTPPALMAASTLASPPTRPFRLFTHCGILTTYISGRTFYLEELYPDRVAVTGGPESPGTLTMLSQHEAEFVDVAGHRIRFVDVPPGQLNLPYPFKMHVLSGGNQLTDEPFAGRRWRTPDTLPGVFGPPYGNGRDSYTTVSGTFTLTSDGQATFRSDAGAIAHFSPLPPSGCD